MEKRKYNKEFKPCLYCGKSFRWFKSYRKLGRGRFCSGIIGCIGRKFGRLRKYDIIKI